jgi:hypothetical protein
MVHWKVFCSANQTNLDCTDDTDNAITHKQTAGNDWAIEDTG